MRIYDGSPRQDFEEVLRSIGAYLDRRNVRDILLMEVPDGFIVQGLGIAGASTGAWSESMGQVVNETMTFEDDDIAAFMEEAAARRGTGAQPELPPPGRYEHMLRVIGHYLDEQKPKDIFFFEIDGSFVVRMHQSGQSGSQHSLAEFTHDDLEALISKGPTFRVPAQSVASPDAAAN
ncbi:MAG: hypothetical protein ABI598_02685 [Chloroflexota bacterium]